jgi:hypothetical protein
VQERFERCALADDRRVRARRAARSASALQKWQRLPYGLGNARIFAERGAFDGAESRRKRLGLAVRGVARDEIGQRFFITRADVRRRASRTARARARVGSRSSAATEFAHASPNRSDRGAAASRRRRARIGGAGGMRRRRKTPDQRPPSASATRKTNEGRIDQR